MRAALVYDPAMARYRFGASHPMRPERFTGAVALMRDWHLIGEPDETEPEPGAVVITPAPAGDDDLLLVHDPALIAAVRAAGTPSPDDSHSALPGREPYLTDHGIGPGDTPAFPGMHDAAALVAGGTLAGIRAVLDGVAGRAFNPAGGMHHAHRDRVAGFCVYNDCAVAIARATLEHPGLKVAYVDIDAHHGDGVEEAFYARDDVLTLSVHESGQYLYPGTGATRQVGESTGNGFALNVPLPPFAGPECYQRVLEGVITTALEAFRPDVIVLQAGADTHRDDPLTHLDLTVRGYVDLVLGIRRLADSLCGGRLMMTGGGGYEFRSAVPRMWACAFAALCDVEIPERLPTGWLSSHRIAQPPDTVGSEQQTYFEYTTGPDSATEERALDLTLRVIAELREHHPLLAR